MIRARYLAISVVAVLTASCGSSEPARDPAQEAARSMIAQSALFCPNEGFSWDAFDAMARELNAAPDDGAVVRPVTVDDQEIVRERWVALDHLGHRTTAWIAEIGPGVRYQEGTAPMEHVSGLVCAIHDPEISREDAFALTSGWEGGRATGAAAAPETPAGVVVTSRAWVNSTPDMDFYQDVEMRVRDREATDGAMFIRHRYDYGRQPAA